MLRRNETMLPTLYFSQTDFIAFLAFMAFLAFPNWLLRLVYVIETIRRLWGKGPR